MRKYFIIPLALAALLLAGQGCLPDAQKQSEALKEMDDQAAVPARGFRLRTEDGKPIPGNVIRKQHTVGRSTCPDMIDNVVVDLGAAVEGVCDLVPRSLPKWLSGRKTEAKKPLIGQGVVLGLEFNCNIDDRSTHTVEVNAGYALDCMGNEIMLNGWKHGDQIDIPVILDLQGK